MSNLYLIGIGGTGARCIEAFVHLCGAGLLFSERGELDNKSEINLLLVDQDKSCGNLVRTQQAVEAYNNATKVGKMEYENAGNIYGAFCNRFKVLPGANPWVPLDPDKSLDDILESGLLNVNERNAYEALFTKEERSTKLDKGFRAHPSIGAAAFTLALNENESPWNEVVNDMRNGARVFVFGSVFGGTGASGFPSIGKVLHRALTQGVGNGYKNWKIGGALILPYFSFPEPEDENDRNEMQGKAKDFMVNTKMALSYYDSEKLIGQENSPYDTVYFIGNNDKNFKYDKFALGADEQKNKSHFVEMFAAIAAFDFFNKKDEDIRPVNMVAREKQNKLFWDDLPIIVKVEETNNQDNEQGYKCLVENRNRIRNFVKFLHVYSAFVHPWVTTCFGSKNDSRGLFGLQSSPLEKEHAWYKKHIKGQGIQLNQNQEVYNMYQELNDYCGKAFAWWRDIATNNNYLIHTEFLGKLNTDPNQVIVDNIQREYQSLSKEVIAQKLVDFGAAKNASYSALMQAIYSICIDREQKK